MKHLYSMSLCDIKVFYKPHSFCIYSVLIPSITGIANSTFMICHICKNSTFIQSIFMRHNNPSFFLQYEAQCYHSCNDGWFKHIRIHTVLWTKFLKLEVVLPLWALILWCDLRVPDFSLRAGSENVSDLITEPPALTLAAGLDCGRSTEATVESGRLSACSTKWGDDITPGGVRGVVDAEK